MKTSYTEVNLKLENIIVTDRNPATIHSKILSIIGGNAMTIQVVLFDLEQTKEYNSDNMKIDVTMGCAKIIFMNWFVSSVLVSIKGFLWVSQIYSIFPSSRTSSTISKLHKKGLKRRRLLQPKQQNRML